jgi:serine/threonine protein kinase/Leucine-rich repeat (LRR) protein
MNATSACVGAADLREYLLGRMSEPTAAAVETHVASCPECQKLLPTIGAEDDFVASFRDQAATPPPADPQLDRLAERLHGLVLTLPLGHDATMPADGAVKPPAEPPPLETTLDQSLSLGPPQLPDEIGRLGGYRILKELGRGGMGVVYQAEDPKLKRLVALKAMLPRLAADKSARQRFLREAQAMAAVHHDHIVTIFQVDENNGVPFLAMEFLDGMPLDKWLKDGRKPSVAQVLRMGREIAEGLSAAHERGLIHRDVKPGNIWLDSAHKGRVKILDFGLARVGTEDVHLTRSGAIVGTPAYMSPEQARGEKVDGRTDLFSLGCVLYRLCTGAMPFAGDTTMGLLLALAMDHPKPVRDVNPEIPTALSDLVMRLLAKTPAERPASAREVVDLIEAIERNPNGVTEANKKGESQTETIALSSSTPAPIPPKRRRTAAFALLAGAAAVVLALAGAVVYVQTDRGTLEINTLDPNVKVSVEQDGARVDILDSKSKQQLSIHSGKYTLKVMDAEGGDLELTTDQGTGPVTLTRGGKVVVTVRRVDKPVEVRRVDKAVEGTAKSAFPPLDEAWVQKVRDLPAEKQIEEVAAELKRRNPGFDGKMTPSFQGLALATDDVADLTPLRALPGLTSLRFSGINNVKCRLSDLSPIKDLKLTQLECSRTQVSDLSPLKDMKLTFLNCGVTRVSDLSPLKGMPLTYLQCRETAISDLSPLMGMPLTVLHCDATLVSDLSPLTGMPLTELHCDLTLVSDLSPLKDMPLMLLYCNDTAIFDLSPLKGMPLWRLNCNSTLVSDLSPLKGMPLGQLYFNSTLVADLSPLKGMNLSTLLCSGTRVSDLSPLRGAPLGYLECQNLPISDLSPLKGMPLTNLYCGGTRVSDLSPLKDMKLTILDCHGTLVSDLSPLKDMPLTDLSCGGTRVSDLSFLKNAPLKNLWCDFEPVRDAEILRSIKTLETIKQKSAAEFWKGVEAKPFPPLDAAWVQKARDLPAEKQVEEVAAELQRRNPGFDGKMTSTLQDKAVAGLTLMTDDVADLTPLRALPGLKSLNFSGIDRFKCRLSDLSTLKDLKLTALQCNYTQISDLSPLKGMPLGALECIRTPVSDLSPLKDMKLTILDCRGTQVSDLSPLKGMPLTSLDCAQTAVFDLSPLKGMPLTSLNCFETLVSDLSPLKDMKLTLLSCFSTAVSDLSPLKGMPLTFLQCNNLRVSDLSPLKGMPLTTLYCYRLPISDLSPLKGMPLTYLHCGQTLVSDLSPLKGMPLTSLDCDWTKVSDLSPLKDMKLTGLQCNFKPERDTEILRSIKTLETINGKPAAEFWKDVDAKKP